MNTFKVSECNFNRGSMSDRVAEEAEFKKEVERFEAGLQVSVEA